MESDRTTEDLRADRLFAGNVVASSRRQSAVTRADASEPLQTVPPLSTQPVPALTLDDLFRRTAERQPDALALCDPPNKLRITGGDPVQLTYAQADTAISAMAAQFIANGLPPGSVIAVQMPNTVEFALTVLAALRAGLVVALLPQLWRRSELTTALNRIGARAMACVNRIEIVDYADLALNAAAEAFSIRHLFGFGNDLPEGITPLEIVTEDTPDAPPVSLDARRLAVITFDTTSEGFRVVPRNHVQLISGALAAVLESDLPQEAKLLSALAPCSFAGLATSLVTWLLTGGSLTFHHPVDLQVLEKQISDGTSDTLIVPGLLALRLADSGLLGGGASTMKHVLSLWRTPERVATTDKWTAADIAMTDLYLFGEVGLFGIRRRDDGAPGAVKPGPFGSAREAGGPKKIGEIVITPKSTLALRGSMVPLLAYRSTWARETLGEPAPDYVDTGYAAQIDRATGLVRITAEPVGIIGVGGYRFLSQDLDEWARRLSDGAMITALPDPLNGFRLAGRANNNRLAREALGELGLTPLMTEAFRERSAGN